jgi:preprotein translocase subunit SecA
VHIITVNDYLARRDAEWMGQIHKWLGLDHRAGARLRTTPPQARQYACDITYGTNNEFGFDYLRDNMALSLRTRCSAATTTRSSTRSTRSSSTRPARRSSSRAGSPTRPSCTTASPAIVRGLKRDVDYEVDEEKRTVAPLEPGIEKVERGPRHREPLRRRDHQNLVHQLTVALKAKELFKRDKDYLIQAAR